MSLCRQLSMKMVSELFSIIIDLIFENFHFSFNVSFIRMRTSNNTSRKRTVKNASVSESIVIFHSVTFVFNVENQTKENKKCD